MRMEDQTESSGKPESGVDKDDDPARVALNKSEQQNPPTPLPSQTTDVVNNVDDPKKSVPTQTVKKNEVSNSYNNKEKIQTREKLESPTLVNENINLKDLQPINNKNKRESTNKSNEEETKNTTATTGESKNSRRSERFKKATQRFANNEQSNEQKTRVSSRSSSRKLSIIVNGNDKPNQPEGLSTNSSGIQEKESNLVIDDESMDEQKPSSMVENRRLSFARKKNIEENQARDSTIIIKKRGRAPNTTGKRVDELFIMRKAEEYHRDGNWRNDAVKIRDRIKLRNLFQCKICKKGMDSIWKLYHHKQVHLEMNYYLCQFCLVGFSIPTSRQLHENTCSRKNNGNSVMKNMLLLYKKEKSQPQSTDQNASDIEQSEMSEMELTPTSYSNEIKPKIIQKSASTKKIVKRKGEMTNLGSENKADDGSNIFSPRRKKFRTKHLVREGEPEFDVQTYDWTKYAKRVQTSDRNGIPVIRFCCLTCAKTQSSKENLFYHMLIHTNEWPYGCNYCERVFRNPINRDKHEEHSCLNRQSLSMGLNDIMALKGEAPVPAVLKKMKREVS